MRDYLGLALIHAYEARRSSAIAQLLAAEAAATDRDAAELVR